MLPTAHVANATVDQVAYASFERQPLAGGTDGNWTFFFTEYDEKAKTGKYVHSLPDRNGFKGWVRKTNLPIGEYLLSYWGKQGTINVTMDAGSVQEVRAPTAPDADGWVSYEYRVTVTNLTNTLTLSGTAKIDEVRLHPTDAQMITFTHQVAVGLAASTDPAGTSSYYEYDGYQRLRLVRDHNHDIRVQYLYWYAGQDETAWQDTGSVRCILGSSGPIGLQEKEQKVYDRDSPNYNQTRWVSNGSPSICRPCRQNEKFDGAICVEGVRVNDRSLSNGDGTWDCFYHYEFPDGTSGPAYSETNPQPCAL